MKNIAVRPISETEAAVVRQALHRAAVAPISEETIRSIEALKVKSICECGCRSVEFDAPEGIEQRLADGVGLLKSGDRVDILVWARNGHIASLEIVDHQGAGESPKPEKVCSWEEAGKNAFEFVRFAHRTSLTLGRSTQR